MILLLLDIILIARTSDITHIFKIVQNCNIIRGISISCRMFVFKTFYLNGISVYKKTHFRGLLKDISFSLYNDFVIPYPGEGPFRHLSSPCKTRSNERRDFAIIYLFQGGSSRRVGESRAVRDVHLYLCSRRKRK